MTVDQGILQCFWYGEWVQVDDYWETSHVSEDHSLFQMFSRSMNDLAFRYECAISIKTEEIPEVKRWLFSPPTSKKTKYILKVYPNDTIRI